MGFSRVGGRRILGVGRVDEGEEVRRTNDPSLSSFPISVSFPVVPQRSFHISVQRYIVFSAEKKIYHGKLPERRDIRHHGVDGAQRRTRSL